MIDEEQARENKRLSISERYDKEIRDKIKFIDEKMQKLIDERREYEKLLVMFN